jgi:hypothetical protein
MFDKFMVLRPASDVLSRLRDNSGFGAGGSPASGGCGGPGRETKPLPPLFPLQILTP